jgi:hypothetical protein
MTDVTSYLQAQTKKAERTFRVAAIAMGVMLVVVFAYFQWLKAELAEVLAPESIAELVVNEARAALPEIGDALEANVRSEAPEIVRFALHQAVDHVLPLLGQMFQATLDEHGRELARIAGRDASAAFDAVLAQYAAERGKGPKKPVTALQLGSFMSARYAAALDDAAAADIEQRLEQAGGTLKGIDARLAAMAGRPGGSREQALGRRLITTWWTFLDRGRPKNVPALAEAEPVAR